MRAMFSCFGAVWKALSAAPNKVKQMYLKILSNKGSAGASSGSLGYNPSVKNTAKVKLHRTSR